MIQNIKVDTIYYLTNSDFEMEFNLCGCCKMRLLTDKAEDTNNFVKLLSRAVSRSQVIICCGKLFDNDGLINIVSKAIKRPLYTVNNADYGIADECEINIIEGSLPLVNSDGCFCGCIAESGPQSIILLTENKSIRKTVMKQLIHPYIEELSVIRNNESSNTNDENGVLEENGADLEENNSLIEEETDAVESDLTAQGMTDTEEEQIDPIIDGDTDQSPEIPAQSEIFVEPESTKSDATSENYNSGDDKENDTSAEKAESNNQEAVDSEDSDDSYDNDSAESAQINSNYELYLEPERVKYSKKSHYELNYVPSERDNEFISNRIDGQFYEEEKNKFLSLPILIIFIVLLVAFAALAYLLVFLPMSSNYTFSEYVKNIFSVAVNISLPHI